MTPLIMASGFHKTKVTNVLLLCCSDKGLSTCIVFFVLVQNKRAPKNLASILTFIRLVTCKNPKGDK